MDGQTDGRNHIDRLGGALYQRGREIMELIVLEESHKHLVFVFFVLICLFFFFSMFNWLSGGMKDRRREKGE